MWAHSSVVFIPKGNKKGTKPRDSRPITLSSFVFKTLERLILWKLEATTLRTNPLHEQQHAFRLGKGTDSAVSAFVDKVEAAYQNGQVAMGVFLDIQGAFNNVSYGSIDTALQSKGFPDWFVHWYMGKIKKRTITVSVGL